MVTRYTRQDNDAVDERWSQRLKQPCCVWVYV